MTNEAPKRVKRYEMEVFNNVDECCWDTDPYIADDGAWVRYEDHHAEVERLTNDCKFLIGEVAAAMKACSDKTQQVERLEREREALEQQVSLLSEDEIGRAHGVLDVVIQRERTRIRERLEKLPDISFDGGLTCHVDRASMLKAVDDETSV